MNDAAIKNFCISARKELRDQVRARLRDWKIASDAAPDLNAIGELPLSADQRAQRKALLKLYRAEGEEQLIERAAYTWFNRLMAIRYMEVHDYLPCHCRVLSAADGSFDPQILKDALTVEIEGADKTEILKLLQQNDDEPLFRYLFLAVCNSLAECMPDVFEPIGSAMELLLPKKMLHKGSVAARMVTDIPEEDWREGVQIVGWMYQYYVSERKDEVFAGFKKGKKAERHDIAPATQLFTPDWIVKYLVQNSLGRLWMLNHPQSPLAAQMEYYIAPGEDAETEFLRVDSPEELTCCDPACGSGHILVYAFDLLALMYEEAGYIRRDIPRAILENNLTGFEIDPRAAAIASFCLAMKGLEYDSRFLGRGVRPRITLLESIEFTEEETESVPALADNPVLVDTLAHLSECGTLFKPEPEDFNTIDTALLQLSTVSNLFAESLVTKLDQAATVCLKLNETYATVVANPPYMGSSNMNKWLANWTKKNYPDSKRDLCTCFIERGFTLAKPNGYSAMITMQSWMFLGSFEALRESTLSQHAIRTLVHIGSQCFNFGEGGHDVVAVAAFVLQVSGSGGILSAIRLVEENNRKRKERKYLEAVANPDCGWFYRRSAETFKSIPGTPIAYWASDAMIKAYESGHEIGKSFRAIVKGIFTGDNERFLRFWHEISRNQAYGDWEPYTKGGSFRKWYGNFDYVVRWKNDGEELRNFDGAGLGSAIYFGFPKISWTKISSGAPHFRFTQNDVFFDDAAPSLVPIGSFGSEEYAILGFLNSSVCLAFLAFLAPTLNYQCGDIKKVPLLSNARFIKVSFLVEKCVALSRDDYESFETSLDFKNHSLI